jgi:hypothetical protein
MHPSERVSVAEKAQLLNRQGKEQPGGEQLRLKTPPFGNRGEFYATKVYRSMQHAGSIGRP